MFHAWVREDKLTALEAELRLLQPSIDFGQVDLSSQVDHCLGTISCSVDDTEVIEHPITTVAIYQPLCETIEVLPNE